MQTVLRTSRIQRVKVIQLFCVLILHNHGWDCCPAGFSYKLQHCQWMSAFIMVIGRRGHSSIGCGLYMEERTAAVVGPPSHKLSPNTGGPPSYSTRFSEMAPLACCFPNFSQEDEGVTIHCTMPLPMSINFSRVLECKHSFHAHFK